MKNIGATGAWAKIKNKSYYTNMPFWDLHIEHKSDTFITSPYSTACISPTWEIFLPNNIDKYPTKKIVPVGASEKHLRLTLQRGIKSKSMI